MGFREFISNFRYRRRVEAELQRYRDINPPANPSRKYVEKLVARLLDEHSAWNAKRELQLIGSAAVPSLLAAMSDSRFQQVEWEKFSSVPAPLESTLELLVEHAANDVVMIAQPFARSQSAKVRKTAALHLASSGAAGTMPALRELMRDEDGYVRSYVRIGIHRAIESKRADDTFRREAYELLLSQADQAWGVAMNDSFDTIILLDPQRAAVDLVNARWLNLENPNTYRILRACNRASILIPEQLLRELLNSALQLAVGERCFPNDCAAAEALRALARRHSSDAATIASSLLNHPKEDIREAAADALAMIAGVVDPTRSVIERVNTDGFEALSRPQRIVYCAFLFDAEVCNGGLMQFFCNSSGDHGEETLEALAELQHEEAHTALQTAIRLIGPISKEQDRELRLTGCEGRWDELQSDFDALESAYYATQSKLRQAWLLYAARHAEDFR